MPSPAALRRSAGLVAAYVAVSVAMTWPLVDYTHFASASYEGDARLVIWILAWANHAVLDGHRLFDANVFYPAVETLRYNEHMFGLSLATLPWAALGASPVLAYNLTWWLAFPLNGLAAFVWLRGMAGSATAAFIGSLVFAFSFFSMLHGHGHLQLVWMWPLPLSAWLLTRWFDRPTLARLAAWVLVFVIGALTSWYMAVIIAVVDGVVGLGLLAAAVRPEAAALDQPWRHRLLHMLAAAIVVAGCVAPFARPYAGLAATPEEAADNAADLAAYLIPPQNTVVGRWWMAHVDDRPRWIWGEQTLFAGWVAVTLGLAGIAYGLRAARDRRQAWTCLALAVAGMLLSFGPDTGLPGGAVTSPFAWLASLPGVAGVRAPARFAIVAMLGLAGLAALGVDRIAARLGRHTWLAWVLIPAMLGEWFLVDFPAGKPVPSPIPAIYRTPAVRAAPVLASLPDYDDTATAYLSSDYSYYSTAHWRPIVNGAGRIAPPGHAAVIDAVRKFATDPDAVLALGIQHVVVHAARPEADPHVLEEALANPRCRLVVRIESDYLFEILPASSSVASR